MKTNESDQNWTSYYNKITTGVYRKYYSKSRSGFTLLGLACAAVNAGRALGYAKINYELIPRMRAKRDTDITLTEEDYMVITDEDEARVVDQVFKENEEDISKLSKSIRIKEMDTLRAFILEAVQKGVIYELELAIEKYPSKINKEAAPDQETQLPCHINSTHESTADNSILYHNNPLDECAATLN